MIDLTWTIEDETDRESELTGAPRPLLGTWHYLRSALRRRWRAWGAVAAVGMLLGGIALVLLPPPHRATVTVLMVHPANLDPESAMGTDVSLLNTREIARRTVAQLGLAMTPEDFQGTISAEPVTTEILHITVAAPDDHSAVVRADTLTEQYLTFRAEQLRSISSGTVDGYQRRIAAMKKQVSSLTAEYAQASAEGAAGQARANEIIGQRAELNAQVVDLQAAIEDATLTADAAISSTHVIDQAAPVRRSLKRAAALNLLSGLVAGTALGMGYVLFRALTSNRLRRRREVAVAIGAPVRYSVGSYGPAQRWGARLRARVGLRRQWRGQDLATMVQGLETAVLPSSAVAAGSARPVRGVALVAVGNSRAAAVVVTALARRLEGKGERVLLVDLSRSGDLTSRRAHAEVYRPPAPVALARGPLGGPQSRDPQAEGDRPPRQEADVVLVLADVLPGIDAENLRTWVTQVVPLVTSGQSSAELLETTSDLVRAAGLDMPFALMLGSDRTDESLGVPDVPASELTGA